MQHFRITINASYVGFFFLTYETADEFFNQISSSPKIHIVFKELSDVFHIEFRGDTCEYKCTVHEQHRKKHHLKNKPFFLFFFFCLFVKDNSICFLYSGFYIYVLPVSILIFFYYEMIYLYKKPFLTFFLY